MADTVFYNWSGGMESSAVLVLEIERILMAWLDRKGQ